MLTDDITVHEGFKPELRYFFFGEVVVFGSLFLFCEKFSNFLEIGIIEGVFSLNDVIDFIVEGFELISEFLFTGFLFCL